MATTAPPVAGVVVAGIDDALLDNGQPEHVRPLENHQSNWASCRSAGATSTMLAGQPQVRARPSPSEPRTGATGSR